MTCDSYCSQSVNYFNGVRKRTKLKNLNENQDQIII